MHKIVSFFKLIRLPNLLMLILAQFIVSKLLNYEIEFSIHFLVSFSTVLIAISGYILNNIEDVEIDKINKTNFELLFSKRVLYILFFASSLFGLLLGFYVSYITSIGNFKYFVFAFIGLVLYAKYLSKYKIVGNILISILVAESIYIMMFFATKDTLFSKKYFNILYIYFYVFFAFAMNWIREIVKDIEDQKGDKFANRKTMPILFGIKSTKIVIIFLFFILCFPLSLQFYFLQSYLLLIVFFLNLFIIFKILKAEKNKDFKFISLLIKISMILGILYPIL